MSRDERTSNDSALFPCDRRHFLKLGAAATTALALPLGCAPTTPSSDAGLDGPPTVDPDAYDGGEVVDFAPESVSLDEALFPLSVQAGAMAAEEVTLWGYASEGRPMRLRLWRPPTKGGDGVVMPVDEELSPSDGGTFKLRVSGLAPATEYLYALFDGDPEAGFTARSHVGRVRTAFPAGWKVPLTLACATCTSLDHAPFRALERTAERRFDALCHLGDMSYNDGAVTLDEYRARWRETLRDPGYRAVLPRGGLYIAWDDHEFTNNLNPEAIDPAQLEAAKTAFFETLPAERGPEGQLWTSYRWGDTAEIILLDCRTERRPSTLDDEEQIYLSEAQMEWAKRTLKESPCHFKIVLNSVPMTNMPQLWALAGDRWQGYRSQRDELLSFLEENELDNVWFLSGDFHVGFVGRVEAEGFGRRLWEIAVGPSGNLGNPLAFLAEQDEYREDVFPARQFTYGKGRLAATFLELDPEGDRVRVQFLDATTGEPLYDEWLSRRS